MSPIPLGFIFSDGVAIAALAVSIVTVIGAYYFGFRQSLAARQANQLPSLISLFEEHRSVRLSEARTFVCGKGFRKCNPAAGLEGVPPEKRQAVLDLMWFYDNLGVLVAHGIVDLDPVAGYLGGSLMETWAALAPLIEVERQKRRHAWQMYFENLNSLVSERGPENARVQLDLWRL